MKWKRPAQRQYCHSVLFFRIVVQLYQSQGRILSLPGVQWVSQQAVPVWKKIQIKYIAFKSIYQVIKI